MNLTQFKSADDAVRLTIRLSVGYCVLLTLAFVSCLIYLSVQIEKAQAQALVIDRKGEVNTYYGAISLIFVHGESTLRGQPVVLVYPVIRYDIFNP